MENRKLNLKVGQEVFIRIGNLRYLDIKERSLGNISEWTYKGTISKVGRKYITLSNNIKFSIEDDYREYESDRGLRYDKLFLSLDDIKEDFILEQKEEYIKKCIETYGRLDLSKNKIETIYDILKENK